MRHHPDRSGKAAARIVDILIASGNVIDVQISSACRTVIKIDIAEIIMGCRMAQSAS